MKDKSFYILNALSWAVLVFVCIEPLSNNVTELWQLWLSLAVVAHILGLIWKSLEILERKIAHGKNKNG